LKSELARQLVIFDMDKTLLSCDSMDLWHRFLEERGVTSQADRNIRRKLKQDYINGVLDVAENFQFEFSLLNEIPRSQQREWQKYFFKNYLQGMVAEVALGLIEQYRKERAFIMLSTSTMSFLAEPVADFIKADHLMATEGCIVDGKYTGEIKRQANYQIGKKINFLNWLGGIGIEFGKTIFYTDSINDIALLELVDVPVAVNPDPILLERAQKNNWQIMDFYSSQSLGN
jgi:HAD superfamily hydrolase (TIGR01490 family)